MTKAPFPIQSDQAGADPEGNPPNQTAHSLSANRQKIAKIALSATIFFALGLQAYTSLARTACKLADLSWLCALPKDPKLYPFLDYPMYNDAKPEGVAVDRFELVAIFPDGSEKILTAQDFQLSQYWFTVGVIASFRDKKDSKIRQYVQAYHELGNPPFVALRFDNHPLLIGEEGVVEGKTDPGELMPARTLWPDAPLQFSPAPSASSPLPAAVSQ